MTDAELAAAINEVKTWLADPDAGNYRMLKLRMLLDLGYVDLTEASMRWEDRHKG